MQRGPPFPHPIEVWIDGSTNQVTVRNTYDDGTEKVRTNHLDVPADLANGIVLTYSHIIEEHSTRCMTDEAVDGGDHTKAADLQAVHERVSLLSRG
jgi:hypothetical protein